MRETFQDRPIRRRETMEFTWPKEMQLIGKCLAVVYSSDKWKEDREFEDYKHLAEAPQHLLAVERFLIDWSTDEPLGGVGPWVVLPQPMPKHFAKLAKFLGVQCRVYEGTDDKPRLEKTPLEFRVARAFLGGAVVPEDKELEYPARVGLEYSGPSAGQYLSGNLSSSSTGKRKEPERCDFSPISPDRRGSENHPAPATILSIHMHSNPAYVPST